MEKKIPKKLQPDHIDHSLDSRGRLIFDYEIEVRNAKRIPYPKGMTPRAKAWGVVRRAPEVLVRVNSRGPEGHGQNIYSYDHLVKAMTYMSRNGKLEVVDESGAVLQGTDALRSRMELWQCLSDIPDEEPLKKKKQEATRLILSMPAGTDREKFKSAVKAWTGENLEGYDFLLAFHDDTKSPHAHILVRSQPQFAYEDLLPRFRVDKERIQVMRESLARLLNERGVAANATRRWSRGVFKPRMSLQAWHVRKLQVGPKKSKRVWKNWQTKSEEITTEVLSALRRGKPPPLSPFLMKSQQTRKAAMGYAFSFIRELEATGSKEDRQLAQELARFYRSLPPVKSMSQQVWERKHREMNRQR